MAKGFLDGVNVKRLGIGILVLFVYIFGTDFVIHGPVLGQLYKDTASVWRPELEMGTYFPYMLVGQFLVAAMFMVIFTKGYQKKGWMEGARYGLLIWVFGTGGNLIQYAVYPLTTTLLGAWIGTSLVQYIVGGILASAVYKK